MNNQNLPIVVLSDYSNKKNDHRIYFKDANDKTVKILNLKKVSITKNDNGSYTISDQTGTNITISLNYNSKGNSLNINGTIIGKDIYNNTAREITYTVKSVTLPIEDQGKLFSVVLPELKKDDILSSNNIQPGNNTWGGRRRTHHKKRKANKSRKNRK
jgi:hypothetical protein